MDERQYDTRNQFWGNKPTKTMQRTTLIFGLLSGLIVSATMVVTMFIYKQSPANFGQGELIGYASMLLSASLIPVAIKSYRDRHQAGIVSFKEAFLMGLVIAVIASVLYVITWAILYKLVYPTFAQDYARNVIDKMKVQGKSVAYVAQKKQEVQAMMAYYDTWPGLLGITFIEIFPVELVVALISALVLKRKGS